MKSSGTSGPLGTTSDLKGIGQMAEKQETDVRDLYDELIDLMSTGVAREAAGIPHGKESAIVDFVRRHPGYKVAPLSETSMLIFKSGESFCFEVSIVEDDVEPHIAGTPGYMRVKIIEKGFDEMLSAVRKA